MSLTTMGARASLRLRGVTLSEGMPLHLWDADYAPGEPFDTVVASATAYRLSNGAWVGAHWRDDFDCLSDLHDRPDHWANQVDWPEEEKRLNDEVDMIYRELGAR
ncbi:MAG: hypothetical protein M1582_01615 [Actinobacteria bacterium]|nr:hypothetical protein [Actinomycetota bacterium]